MSTITDTFIAPPCHDPIEILYQDDHLALINKPAGLLSLSGRIRRISIRYTTGWYRSSPAAPWCTAWISARPG